MSPADQVWNRAALERGGKAPLEGDLHIVALIALHSLMMNGDLEHAMEFFSRDEYLAGVAGFRFLGLTEAATLLELANSGADLEAIESAFLRLVPSDAFIAEAYERTYADSPHLFAAT